MNVALIMSAVKQGAVIANHCGVTALHKLNTGKLNSARVKDNLTGEEWDIRAKASLDLIYDSATT
jgi:glycerol-3-phosphate dehydrogenase